MLSSPLLLLFLPLEHIGNPYRKMHNRSPLQPRKESVRVLSFLKAVSGAMLREGMGFIIAENKWKQHFIVL